MSAINRSHSARIKPPSLEGIPIHDVFTHPSLSGWAVAVAAPVAAIGRSGRDASFVAAVGLLTAILAASALAGWFGRKHVRSMGRAVQAAIDLGNGIPPGARHSRVIEVKKLHAALHAAGEQLLQAHAYRKHAETERQTLLEGEQKARVMAEQQNSAHQHRRPVAQAANA